jgi:hypothetical protein
MNFFEKQKIDNLFMNIGTMPPAILLNYGSFLDQYPYLQNQKKDKK